MKTTLICTNNTPFFLSVLSYSFLAIARFLVFFLGIIGFDENHLRGGGNAGGKRQSNAIQATTNRQEIISSP